MVTASKNKPAGGELSKGVLFGVVQPTLAVKPAGGELSRGVLFGVVQPTLAVKPAGGELSRGVLFGVVQPTLAVVDRCPDVWGDGVVEKQRPLVSLWFVDTST